MSALTIELQSLFPEYTPVSLAPSFGELEAQAKKQGVSLEWLMKQESEKRYSAAKEMDGKRYFFLVQNPAWGTYQVAERCTVVVKAKPQPIFPDTGKKSQTKWKQLGTQHEANW